MSGTLDAQYRQQRWLNSLLAPLRAKLRGMVRRVVVDAITSDAGDTARFRGSHVGEAPTDGEHLQQYGFASSPPGGGEGIYFKSLGVTICVDHRTGRPAIAAGEVAVWHKSGAMIVFREDGSIVALPKTGKKVELGGEPGAQAVARVTDTVGSAAGMVTWMSQVAGFINAATPGTVTPPAPPDFGTVTTGAQNVRAT